MDTGLETFFIVTSVNGNEEAFFCLESKKRGGNCKNIMDYYGKTLLEPKFVSFGMLIGA